MSMNVDFYFRKKIPVGVLGASGKVGQTFVKLLAGHPWFQLFAVAASEKSVGKKYHEVVSENFPDEIASMMVQPCRPELPCTIVFSALDSSVAGEIEEQFAKAGYIVVSNAKNHRMDPDVPLVVPEVNSRHIDLVKNQSYSEKGMIVTNPNCAVVGLVMALKPLVELFGVKSVHVVTMQAISGAGKAGELLNINDNIIPYIVGEEEKIEEEPLKVFGEEGIGVICPYPMKVSAQCNRVFVTDGHTESVSVQLKSKATLEEVREAWDKFTGEASLFDLYSAPTKPIRYWKENDWPQPKLHRELDRGMVVSVGGLRPCKTHDFKFTVLSHNMIRGAAGGAILNAELLVKKGYVFW